MQLLGLEGLENSDFRQKVVMLMPSLQVCASTITCEGALSEGVEGREVVWVPIWG